MQDNSSIATHKKPQFTCRATGTFTPAAILKQNKKLFCNTHRVGKFVGIRHGRLTKQRYHKGCTVPRNIPHTCM